MTSDDTSDANDGDGRDRRDGSDRDGSARTRDDPDSERRSRSTEPDPRADGSAQERRRYEPVGRPRREVPHGSDRSRRMQDPDRSAPERDAWSVLDGDLRESSDESPGDPDGASADGGDAADETAADEAERGEGTREDEPVDRRSGSEREGREREEPDPSGRRLYSPVGEDPAAARERFRRRAGRSREPGRRAERDGREPASRSQLRARSLDDAGRDPNARPPYPPRDAFPFDDERGATGPAAGERGPEQGRSDRRAHQREGTDPSDVGGDRSDEERSDGGRYDRWRLLHELESRAVRDEPGGRDRRPRRPPY